MIKAPGVRRGTNAPFGWRAVVGTVVLLVLGGAWSCGRAPVAVEQAVSNGEVPKTAAGTVFASWLAAFNSAEPAQMHAFEEAHGRTWPVERLVGLRGQTGGLTVLRIETSAPSSLVALVQERDSDTVARFELSVDSGEPPQVVTSTFRIATRPPELAIQRMTEADALAALSAQADAVAGKDRFSGALLVARHGEVLFQKTWGQAVRAAGTAVTLDTKFRLGSMNKMFTAIATLQLVEAGELALDDTLGMHLPDYPNKEMASKVTVRHLLTHTGGTGDIFGPFFTNNRLTLQAHSDYVALYGARRLRHEPGAEHRYSNYGYVLLGRLVERVSGGSYYEYVREKVFQPAGMEATGSLPEVDEVPHRAIGYLRRDDGWRSNAETLPWRGTAAGGGYSTVGDLFRFAQALKAGTLVSKSMLAEATRAQAEQYGYGFVVRGDGALSSYGHGGGAPGMSGDLRVFPRLGYVVVGLSNLDPPAASRLVEFFTLRMPDTAEHPGEGSGGPA